MLFKFIIYSFDGSREGASERESFNTPSGHGHAHWYCVGPLDYVDVTPHFSHIHQPTLYIVSLPLFAMGVRVLVRVLRDTLTEFRFVSLDHLFQVLGRAVWQVLYIVCQATTSKHPQHSVQMRLRRFLDFANFHQQFLCYFSSITAHLNSPSTRPLFHFCHILVHPDPVAVFPHRGGFPEAVLSQQPPEPGASPLCLHLFPSQSH